MHSFIYQVNKTPIAKEDYLKADGARDGDMAYIDYSDVISGEEREQAIKQLVANVLPKGMFSLNPDYNLTYNGGIEEWRKRYCEQLKAAVDRIKPEEVLSLTGVYKLRKTIMDPFNSSYLFVTDSYGGYGTAECSVDFMWLISQMTKGDTLYIGGVCDYHI